jgi:hypothetical protein
VRETLFAGAVITDLSSIREAWEFMDTPPCSDLRTKEAPGGSLNCLSIQEVFVRHRNLFQELASNVELESLENRRGT